jgi:DNA polymerase-3 subunit delta
LASGLKQLYVIHGDAVLLASEAADSIRTAAFQAGYVERDILTAEQHFKWEELENAAQSLSLFAQKKIVDLRIPSGKPGIEGSAALRGYVSRMNSDVLTMITLPKLDWTAQKTPWFNALEEHGVVISANDIQRNQLPGWLAARLSRQKQSLDSATLEFLADRCEGNLLAAFQEIQKLALLFPPGPVSFEQVKEAVMEVARYDIFKLTEAMLTGNTARYAHILEGLRDEGTASVLVLWAICEEIRNLGKLLYAVRCGASFNDALRELRIRREKQGLIESTAHRLKFVDIERAVHHAAKLDKMVKGLRSGDIWDELLQLGLRFAKP